MPLIYALNSQIEQWAEREIFFKGKILLHLCSVFKEMKGEMKEKMSVCTCT